MIHGLSEKRRMPRAGRVRLGIVVQEPGRKPYPRATSYFVCTPAVRKVFGEEPRALDIMFPVDDPEQIFPQTLSSYTKTGGLFCRGDGKRALRWQGKDLAERSCPCELLESGKCRPLATLNFLLPDVAGIGIYQCSTANKASIVAINSGLEQFAAMFGGLRGIPFKLLLEPQKAQRWDEAQKRHVLADVYVLRLDSERTLREIVEWRARLGKPVEALMPVIEADAEEPAALPAHEDNGHDAELPAGQIVAETASGRPITQDGEVLEGAAVTHHQPAPEPDDDSLTLESCYRRASAMDIDRETFGRYLAAVHGDQIGFIEMPEIVDALAAAEKTPQTRAAFKAAVNAKARKAGASA